MNDLIRTTDFPAILSILKDKFPWTKDWIYSTDIGSELQEALQALGIQTDQTSNGDIWIEFICHDETNRPLVNRLTDLADTINIIVPYLK